jgi:HK97 family phage prohead protease
MSEIKLDGDAALRHAIRKLARGDSTHDAARLQVIAGAKTLDLRGLIPDNWASDGALRSTDGVWATQEQRETWNDIYAGLQSALDEMAEGGYDDGWGYYVWIQDVTDTEVIFCSGGELYSAPYTFEPGGPVTIGDRIKVRPVSSYVEMTTTRAAPAMREWRKNKASELKGLERRTFDVSDLELRSDDETGVLHLTGYASVTETPYDVGFYEETIARGAFKRTLNEDPDVQLLINHGGLPLARTKSGTLRLEERERGLWVDADLDPEDPDVQSLQRKMARGDIDQMSFAFQATDSDWSDDFTQRRIKTVSIHRGDVSVVNMGANPASTATIRSQDAAQSLNRGGSDALLTALTEWRDHTLLPDEQRADASLTEATLETLSQLANVVAPAGDAGDESKPLLAAMVAMPTPAAPAADEPVARDAPAATVVALPDHTTRARQTLAALNAGRR